MRSRDATRIRVALEIDAATLDGIVKALDALK